MAIYRRIVKLATLFDLAVPPRGFNLYRLDDTTAVIWCSDNLDLAAVDRKDGPSLRAALASLGTELVSHPNNPPAGTFQVLTRDFKTVLESG